MQIGIIGLPQSGKHTLFSLLTGISIEKKGRVKGEAEVYDPRLEKLSNLYPEKRKVPAKVHFILFPALSPDNPAITQEVLKGLSEVAVICYVIRAFKNERVFHIEGSVEPLRDIRRIDDELLFYDLSFVELRLERLEKAIKREKKAEYLKEKEILGYFKSALEKGEFLSSLTLNSEMRRVISVYPLLTLKKQIIILNVDEQELGNEQLPEKINKEMEREAVQISVKIEQELFQLESKREQEEFLSALNIKEPALYKITRVVYQLLGLISFFTIGKEEVRAWSIVRGTRAVEAAGKVHSDMQRGFIRAEVIKLGDLLRLGSKQAVQSAGLSSFKGRDYIVEDGDIIEFRFSV